MSETTYREGISLGHEFAEADLHDGAACGAMADELRLEARQARTDDTSRAWIAFKLGIVRGYREATRSKLNGRWGT